MGKNGYFAMARGRNFIAPRMTESFVSLIYNVTRSYDGQVVSRSRV